MNENSTTTIVNLREFWNTLDAETMGSTSETHRYEPWEDSWDDDCCCCVGGFSK